MICIKCKLVAGALASRFPITPRQWSRRMDTHPVPSGASDRSAWGGGVSGFPEFAVIAALMFAALPFLFAETLYAPALPVFVKLYHAPVSDVSWLLTGHLLFAAVATPIAGRLGDLYGRGRLLVI